MNKDIFRFLNFSELLDLNYNLKEDFQILEKFPQRYSSNLIKPICLFFSSFFKSLFNGLYRMPALKSEVYLAVSSSKNNNKVILPISEGLDRCLVIGPSLGNSFPRFLAHLYALPYFFHLIGLVRNLKGYDRRVAISFFHLFWITFGYLRIWNKILSNSNIKVVIFSNDHLAYYRTLTFISKKLSILTVYLQHAGISERFPPLSFDYALLDGEISKDKYMVQSRDSKTNILLLGSVRFDKIARLRFSRTDSRLIGLSLNLLDDEFKVVGILKAISVSNLFGIVVRFHPGFSAGRKLKLKELFGGYVQDFSDPDIEPLELYLSRIRLHLSGVSFIHFEAILSGINSFKIETSSYAGDPYGFSDEFVIQTLIDFDILKNEQNWILSEFQMEYLRSYVANYDSLLDGEETLPKYLEVLRDIYFDDHNILRD
ncbi:hypothetical protein [Algoriphagus terrigena]|uniref:hypothetical protein n=1 Tax=Algoriphagus terrigena TaxID=344884 RepID=UPI000401A0E4|nr:hypothetical protein [Algoriphagus terrigena]